MGPVITLTTRHTRLALRPVLILEGYPSGHDRLFLCPFPVTEVGWARMFSILVRHHLSVPFSPVMFTPSGFLDLTTREVPLLFSIRRYKHFP